MGKSRYLYLFQIVEYDSIASKRREEVDWYLIRTCSKLPNDGWMDGVFALLCFARQILSFSRAHLDKLRIKMR